MDYEYFAYGAAALVAVGVLAAIFGRETVKGWVEAVWKARK